MIFGTTSPTWFLGFDSILETLFLLVTLLIAWYAWRIHRFVGGKQYKRWSIGFLLIAAAYAINAVTNFLLYQEIIESTVATGGLSELTRIYNLGLLIHMLFFLSGYLILALVALRIDDVRLSPLLTFFVLATALAALPFSPVFEIATAILLLYLIVLTLRHTAATKRRSTSNRLVVGGFAFVLLAQLAYLFLPLWSVSYVVGHVLELLGYALLITSMAIILRGR